LFLDIIDEKSNDPKYKTTLIRFYKLVISILQYLSQAKSLTVEISYSTCVTGNIPALKEKENISDINDCYTKMNQTVKEKLDKGIQILQALIKQETDLCIGLVPILMRLEHLDISDDSKDDSKGDSKGDSKDDSKDYKGDSKDYKGGNLKKRTRRYRKTRKYKSRSFRRRRI
jgi:hypothetical protein